MTEEQALNQLRSQVEQMMKELCVIAQQKLDHLARSGAGIVEQHIENTEKFNMETWGSAKEFMVAFLEQQPDQYRRPHESREDRKRIKNYGVMM